MDLSKLSAAQLKAALEQKEAEERKEREAKRKVYEDRREQIINSLGVEALAIHNEMATFKAKAFEILLAFRTELLEYGELRRGENNKGSFSIKNERYKIEVSSQITKSFDERSELAEEKLQLFLKTLVKKRDKAAYELVNAAVQRNEKTGSFDPDVVNRLYKIEDKFDDSNWKEALRLFKESYSPSGTAMYVRFSMKTSAGSWKSIVLDWASVEAKKKEVSDAA